jgi:hypothetical protein
MKLFFPAPIIEAPQAVQESPGRNSDIILMVDTLKSIQSRLEVLETQRLRVDIVWIGVSCFIAGLLVGLAVWWFQ